MDWERRASEWDEGWSVGHDEWKEKNERRNTPGKRTAA